MHLNVAVSWALLVGIGTFVWAVIKGVTSLLTTALSIRDHIRDGLKNIELSCDGLRKDVDELSGVVKIHDTWFRELGRDRRGHERRSET